MSSGIIQPGLCSCPPQLLTSFMQGMAATGATAQTPSDVYRVQILFQAGLIHTATAQSLMGSAAPLGPSPSHMRHIDMGREHLADGCRLLAGISTAFESTSPDDIDEYREISLQIDSHENHLNWLIDELGRIEDAGHAEDVADASRIAHNNLLRLDALLHARRSRTRFEDVSIWDFTEPIEERPATAHTGRHGGSRRAPPPPVPISPGIIIPDVIAVERPGFRNRLIPEQWNSIDSLDGYWERLGNVGGKLLPHYTVVAPTGWGKSWAMAGVIELGITRGRLDFGGEGSQVLIFDHRTDITAQNFRRIRDCLAPVFAARYGRAPRITLYAGNEADCTGDIVIVSLPKAGRKEALPDFLKRLSDAGKKVGLIHVDEVHHSEGDLWRKAIGEAVSYARTKVHRPFVVGWTATLPDDMRPSRVIAYEMTAREGMSRGIIPTVHLQPVRTGVSIQNVRMHAGDFSERDLSRTVRNYARDRRTMEVIDFTAARDPRHVLERISVVGVDVAHARELALYMQMYFSDTGRPRQFRTQGGRELPWLGVHQVYVLDEGASPEEVRSVLDAYASREEYPIPQFASVEASKMGNASDLRYGRLGDSPRRRIGMIAAVVSGKTRPESWRLIWDAWERGIIPVVFSNKKLEEGVDAKHVLEYVRGRPSLDPIVTEQGFGRFLRYMDDEIDRNTGELRMVRRRVAYDLVDDSSRPIVYLGEVLGFTGQDCRTWEGSIVNLQTGAVTDDQIGGFHDLIVRREDGTPALRKPPEIPVYPTKIVQGARKHRLRTDEENLSPFCLALRRTWLVRFRSNIAAMSLWLGCREEELVSFLNGELPGTERQTQRFATLIGMKRHNLDAEWLMSGVSRLEGSGLAYSALHNTLIGAYVFLRGSNISGPWSGGESITGQWKKGLTSDFFSRTIGPEQLVASCREIHAGLAVAARQDVPNSREQLDAYEAGVRALMTEGFNLNVNGVTRKWVPVDTSRPQGRLVEWLRTRILPLGGVVIRTDIRPVRTTFASSIIDLFDNGVIPSLALVSAYSAQRGSKSQFWQAIHDSLKLSNEDSAAYWHLLSDALREEWQFVPLLSIMDPELRELVEMLWIDGALKNYSGAIAISDSDRDGDRHSTQGRAPKGWTLRQLISHGRFPDIANIAHAKGNPWQQALEILKIPRHMHGRYWHLLCKLTRRYWKLPAIESIPDPSLRALVGMLWNRAIRMHGGPLPQSIFHHASAVHGIYLRGEMPSELSLATYRGNIWKDIIDAFEIPEKHRGYFWRCVEGAYCHAYGHISLDKIGDEPTRKFVSYLRDLYFRNCGGHIDIGRIGSATAPDGWMVTRLLYNAEKLSGYSLGTYRGNPWADAITVFKISEDAQPIFWQLAGRFMRSTLGYSDISLTQDPNVRQLAEILWESAMRCCGGWIRQTEGDVSEGYASREWPLHRVIQQVEMPSKRSIGHSNGNPWRDALTVTGMPNEQHERFWDLASNIMRSIFKLPRLDDIDHPRVQGLSEFLWSQFMQAPKLPKVTRRIAPGEMPGQFPMRVVWEHGRMPSRQGVGTYHGNLWDDTVIALQMDDEAKRTYRNLLTPALRELWGFPAFEDVQDIALRNLAEFLWDRSLRMPEGYLPIGQTGPGMATASWPLRQLMENPRRLSKKSMSHSDVFAEGEIVFGLSGEDLAQYHRLVAAYEGR